MSLIRSRNNDGRERRKRNDTRVDTLQEEYGERFAPGVRGNKELGNLKSDLDLEPDASLDDVLRHYKIRKR
jgi:hypothetical protein